MLTTGGIKKILIDSHNVDLFKACCEAYNIEAKLVEFWVKVGKSEMLLGYEWNIPNINLSGKLDPNLDADQRMGVVEYGLPLDQISLYKIVDFPHHTELSFEEIADKYNSNVAMRGFRLVIIPFQKNPNEIVVELFKVDENQQAYHLPTTSSGSSIAGFCDNSITDIVPI